MRATKFEFEQRFWFMGFIFWAGFSLSAVDRTNCAAALLHFLAPGVNPDSARGSFLLRSIFGGGALLVFLAALLRTWATAYLRPEIVHDMKQHSEALVAEGPFRCVRNPLYLANLPMAAGIALMASRLGWLFIVAAVWLFVYRLILREESGLVETQAESYRAYLRAVPRFWPSFEPRVLSGNAKPQWGKAFAAEMFIWLLGAGELCLALTLNVRLTGIVFIASFATYFVVLLLMKMRSGNTPT